MLPTPLPRLTTKSLNLIVDRVACGAAHNVMIVSGDVYTWGKCHFGQLGLGQQQQGFLGGQIAGLSTLGAQQQAQAVAGGAFGGAREGVQRAEFGAQSLQDRAALQAQLLQQGFGQAQQQASQKKQYRTEKKSPEKKDTTESWQILVSIGMALLLLYFIISYSSEKTIVRSNNGLQQSE